MGIGRIYMWASQIHSGYEILTASIPLVGSSRGRPNCEGGGHGLAGVFGVWCWTDYTKGTAYQIA